MNSSEFVFCLCEVFVLHVARIYPVQFPSMIRLKLHESVV